jgi:hypothetical protein
LRYVKAFIITGLTVALLAHYVTVERMPWWPDTIVFGGFMGALGAFIIFRLQHFHHASAPIRGLWRALTGKRS